MPGDALPTVMPDRDLELVAVWHPISYDVVFYSNGGTGFMEFQTFTYDVPQALSPNAFAFDGHAFRAWSTSPTGDGLVFADREIVSNLTDTREIVVLYALWDDVVCTVSFDSNGGTAVPSASVAWGSRVDRPADPVRTGYSLAGWFADADLTDMWDFGSDRVSGNIVLHAKWDAVRYAVVYSLDGGEDPGNPSWYTVESGDIILMDASRDGRVFCGWYLDPGFTHQVGSISAGSTGDVILYARWTPDPKEEGTDLALGAVIAVMTMAFASLIVTRRK